MNRHHESYLQQQRYDRQVVQDVVLLSIQEVVGLVGPNAGKTTTFYMIVGLVANDKGKIILDGKDVTYAPMHGARRGIGYCHKNHSFSKKLSMKTSWQS